jgi:hypothetical protein
MAAPPRVDGLTSSRTTLSHCCADRPNRDPADVDADAQISAFVKLKLANCAGAPQASLDHNRGYL